MPEHDTAMATALRKAGVRPPIERLHEIVRKVITYSQDPGVVMAAIVKSADVEAALCLIDPQVAAARLKALIRELTHEGGQGSRTREGHTGGTAGRAGGGGHEAITPSGGHRPDTPAAPLPVHVREHSRHKPGHAKTRSLAAKTGLAASAYKGIFAREIGSGRKTVGDITKFEVIQIKRRGLIDSHIADGLLALDWPDEQKTKLAAFATEEQVNAVFARAYRALDSLGLAHGTA